MPLPPYLCCVSLLPCFCRALAVSVPCDLSCSCRVVAVILSCRCLCFAESLPCFCHVFAKSSSCLALYLPRRGRGLLCLCRSCALSLLFLAVYLLCFCRVVAVSLPLMLLCHGCEPAVTTYLPWLYCGLDVYLHGLLDILLFTTLPAPCTMSWKLRKSN